jgi:hypothetical protein
MPAAKGSAKAVDLPFDQDQIIEDYRLAFRSRQASLIGRREVLSGKAKFGIFGDGKELANIAIGHAFRKGDWRSGYYRDQTWMDMLGIMSIQQLFAQLLPADLEADQYWRAGMSALRQPLRHRRLLDRSNRSFNTSGTSPDRNPNVASCGARLCVGGV